MKRLFCKTLRERRVLVFLLALVEEHISCIRSDG